MLCPIFLLWGVIVALYIPPVQNYVVKEITRVVSENSDFKISFDKFHLIFPLKAQIKNFTITHKDSLIADGEKLEIDLHAKTLLKGEIEINYISIDNTRIDSHNLIESAHVKSDIGHFRTTVRNIVLNEEKASIRQLHLVETKTEITLFDKEKEEETSESANWIIEIYKANIQNCETTISIPQDSIYVTNKIERLRIYDTDINLKDSLYSVGKIDLSDSSLSFDKGLENDSTAPLNHQHLRDIEFEGNNLLFSNDKLNGELRGLKLKQKDGTQIVDAGLNIVKDSKELNIENIHLRTLKGSKIYGDITLPHGVLNGIIEGNIGAKLNMQIDKADLKKFITSAQLQKLDLLTDTLIYAGISSAGTTRRINIDTIYVNIPTMSYVGLRGYMSNITDIGKMDGNLEIQARTTDLYKIIHMQSPPENIGREAAWLRGNIKMSEQRIATSIRLRANRGAIRINAVYDNKKNEYAAKARVRRFDIRKIMPNLPMHSINLNINANGAGTNIFSKDTRYNCSIAIDTLCYDSTRIGNIMITATQENGISDIYANSQDPNLHMNIKSKSRIDSLEIINDTRIDIHKADFYEMGILKAPFNAKMNIDIQAYTNMQQRHAIEVKGDGFKLITQESSFTPAPLVFRGYTAPDTSYVNLTTGDLNIHGHIGYGYMGLLSTFEKLKGMYNKARTSDNTIYYVNDYQKHFPTLAIDINCGQNNILSNFLKYKNIEYNNFNVDLSLDSIKGINGRSSIYQLRNGEMQLDTIRISLRQREERISYFAGVRTRSLNPQNPKLKFYAALLGSLKNDSLITRVLFRDNNDDVGARFEMQTKLYPERVNVHFTPKATFFNKPFKFNDDNYIQIRKNLAIRTNLELLDTLGAGISLQSMDTTMLRDINAKLINIDLNTITKYIPYTPDISGILDMDLQYRDNNNGILIISDIRGTGLAYEGTHIGNEVLKFSYMPKGEEAHYTQLILRHNKKKILDISGDYYKNSKADMQASIISFPLGLSHAFIKDSGVQLDGSITGRLKIKGSLEEAQSNGFIKFESTSANAPAFSTRLYLKDGEVQIRDNKLQFDNFDIYAQGSTPFKINGTIDMHNFINPEFNISMRANSYELINTSKKKSSMLYGRLLLDVNSRITGRLKALNISGSGTMLGNSDITYVMHETPLAAESELDGLVQFVNFNDTTQINKVTNEIDLGNLTLSMKLSIEEGARINAELDANRNNYIELKGGGNLNLTYSSEDNLSLTGRYTMSDGQLKYTLPIIPLKTFNISEGSYIYWSGDVANPTLNITALERVTSSVTLDDGTTQAVAFDVGVELSNTLEDMGLSFTLSAPENAAVQNELNALDKETRNKYAVTMLITGAYIGGKGGITVSNALSSFLDAQINDIAGNAMKSVDINVGITDLENSETGGTYKTYSFSYAQRFWNDRITFIIGGEVNSGETPNQDKSFLNNVSVEFRINKSGSKYLRLFYDKNYESILEGEIIETGVGYIYKRKLNSLKELFIFRKKKNNEQLIIEKRNNKDDKENEE